MRRTWTRLTLEALELERVRQGYQLQLVKIPDLPATVEQAMALIELAPYGLDATPAALDAWTKQLQGIAQRPDGSPLFNNFQDAWNAITSQCQALPTKAKRGTIWGQ